MAPAPDGEDDAPRYRWYPAPSVQSYSNYDGAAPTTQTPSTPVASPSQTSQGDGISQTVATFTQSTTSTHMADVYTSAPTTLSTTPYTSTVSTPTSFATGSPQEPSKDLVNGMPPWLLSVVVVVPVIVVILSGLAIFWIIRARRKQREAAAGIPEMKDLATARPPVETAHLQPNSPPTMTIASSTPPTARSPVPQATPPPTQRMSQPVILSNTINQSYFTGLDTSDHLSLSDNRSQNSAEPYEDGDEPPPPYRPRSVPSISRDASVRTAHTTRTSSNARRSRDYGSANADQSHHLICGGIRRSVDVRSPFEDPEDDDEDAVSEVTIRPQRHASQRTQQDRLSVVSDLSYQDEPTQPRSSLS